MHGSVGPAREPCSIDNLTQLFFSLSAETVLASDPRRLTDQVRYFRDRAVGTDVDTRSIEAKFGGTAVPETAIEPPAYLDFLAEQVLPHAANMYSRYCLGHMTSAAPDFFWRLSEIVAALNQNMAKREASLIFSVLERQTLAIMHRLVYGFDDTFYACHTHDESSSLGIFASGGTVANITALWVARNLCFPPDGGFRGVETEGMSAALAHYGCRGAVLVGSALMHYSIDKAASLLGLGATNAVKVGFDCAYRIDLNELRRTLRQCAAQGKRVIAVVAVAGSTDAGSIDPLAEMAEIAAEHGAPLHVDAAWGAPLLFSQRLRGKVAGIEKANSVTIDGHKQMYLPIANSMVLFRDPHAASAIEKQTHYMLQKDSGDLGMRSLEGSRPASTLFFHAAFHVIGRLNYAHLIEENLRKALEFAALVRIRPDFQLVADPETNIVLYRYLPDWCRSSELVSADQHQLLNAYNEAIQRAQSAAGRTFVSRTYISPRPGCNGHVLSVVALRAVISNPFTVREDFERILDDQAVIASELAADFTPSGRRAIASRSEPR